MQKEVEKQNAEEAEALRRSVQEAIQVAQELERPVLPAAFETPEQSPDAAIPNGQYEQESQPNLTQ